MYPYPRINGLIFQGDPNVVPPHGSPHQPNYYSGTRFGPLVLSERSLGFPLRSQVMEGVPIAIAPTPVVPETTETLLEATETFAAAAVCWSVIWHV